MSFVTPQLFMVMGGLGELMGCFAKVLWSLFRRHACVLWQEYQWLNFFNGLELKKC